MHVDCAGHHAPIGQRIPCGLAFAPEPARFATLVDVTGLVIYFSIDREPDGRRRVVAAFGSSRRQPRSRTSQPGTDARSRRSYRTSQPSWPSRGTCLLSHRAPSDTVSNRGPREHVGWRRDHLRTRDVAHDHPQTAMP